MSEIEKLVREKMSECESAPDWVDSPPRSTLEPNRVDEEVEFYHSRNLWGSSYDLQLGMVGCAVFIVAIIATACFWFGITSNLYRVNTSTPNHTNNHSEFRDQ